MSDRQIHVINSIAGLAEWIGGPPRVVAQLAAACALQGTRVDLIAGRDYSDPDRLVMPPPELVATHFLPLSGPFWMFGPQRIKGMIRSLTAQPAEARVILHDHGLWLPFHLAVGRSAKSLGLPYVINPHGMLEPWALEQKAGRKRLAWLAYQRRLLQEASALLATADNEFDSVRKLFPRRPIALIPNGVPIPEDPIRPERAPDQPRILLFLSRLHPKKNIIGMLEAWQQSGVSRRTPPWRLRIAGPDEDNHQSEIERAVARLGLNDSVELVGSIPEVDKAKAFEAADLFILPTFSENFGIVVPEALAHRVPVIATNGAPWQDLPRVGCGWCVDPTVEALAGALAEATALDDATLREMGERGRRYTAATYGWEGIATKTIALYRWLLYGGVRPDFVDV